MAVMNQRQRGRSNKTAWLLVCVILFVAGTLDNAFAADAETRAFQDGVTSLDEGFAERAERTFADFVVKFPRFRCSENV